MDAGAMVDEARVALGAGSGAGGAQAPGSLAEAARRVASAIVEVADRAEGEILGSERQSLSETLGAEVSWEEFAAVVAETLALGWAESGGKEVELPGALQPVEAVWIRPGSESVAATLEALRQVAARSGAETGCELSDRDLYESFLAEFDPEGRARSSVFVTPTALVRMLVESVDELLRDRLGVSAGLADPEVSLLDPAAGTGAFLLAALRVSEKGGSQHASSELGPAGWRGFEVRPGAYVAGMLRLAQWRKAAESTGGRVRSVDLHFGDALADDSPMAEPSMGMGGRGERPQGPMVVLGNPPWSRTQVCSRWMERLLRAGYRRHDGSVDEGYFRYQGRPVDSRNPKWLRALYVQFLRLAQRCVDRVGRGVVALVLPDGIADNLTFGGLRESLLGSFEEIFLLDLGGSSRKVKAEHGADDNVFDVRQGVCAVVLVKGGTGTGVFRTQVRGRRREKLAWLASQTVSTINWQGLRPGRPGHALLPRDGGVRGEESYWQAPSIPEIFEVGSIGVITGRDALVVGFGERELAARIGMLRRADGDGRIWEVFGVKGSAQLERALTRLAADEDWERHLVPYLFRPGDRRVLFSAGYLVGRPRTAVMSEVRRPANVALLLPRRRRVFPSAWVTDCTASHRVASAYEGSHAFPLYVGAERQPNFTPELRDELAGRYGSSPAPEDLFGYVYWQLWSRAFYERYSEALGQDWPRVVFPDSFEEFIVRARLGWRLAQIHLGWERSKSRSWLHGELPVRLADRERPFEYDGEERLCLGLEGGFLAPVGREVMAFGVGGYRVVPGWIRRRAGRRLGGEDIEALCRLIGVLEATRRIQDHLAGLEI